MARTGYKFTEEQIRRLKESHKGQVPWNKGMKTVVTKFCVDCGKTICKKATRCNSCSTKFKVENNLIRKHRMDVWDNEDKIIALYNENKTMGSISKLYKCDPGVIQKVLLKNNITIRPPRVYMYGHKFNVGRECKPETRIKIGLAHLGRKSSPETVAKMIASKKGICPNIPHLFKKGMTPWNKGLTKETDERVLKNALSKIGILRTEEARKKIKEKRAKQITPKYDTKIEIKIREFLDNLQIEYFQHKYLSQISHAYQCDFFIPSMNLVVECDGDYWHKYPTGRDLDKVRTSELIQKGFRVLRLWEHEIKAMDINKFNEVLKQYGKS